MTSVDRTSKKMVNQEWTNTYINSMSRGIYKARTSYKNENEGIVEV